MKAAALTAPTSCWRVSLSGRLALHVFSDLIRFILNGSITERCSDSGTLTTFVCRNKTVLTANQRGSKFEKKNGKS